LSYEIFVKLISKSERFRTEEKTNGLAGRQSKNVRFWSYAKPVWLLIGGVFQPANSTSDTIFLSTEKRD